MRNGMSAVLRIYDETSSGQRLNELTIELRLVREKVTVRELIRRRVRAEVQRYNAQPTNLYRGLVQPKDAERVGGGYHLATPKPLEESAHVDKALEAFERGGFLLLVGDTQEDDLEAEVVLGEDVEVRFVKLVPLVGG
jgi:hypothetical protein